MFHIPEGLEQYRLQSGPYKSKPGEPFGAFKILGPCGAELMLLATDGADEFGKDWEHVSVSTRERVPNWKEMCFVKNLFWPPEDCVVQFHPSQTQYVNIHNFVLHLWRHRTQLFPMPPIICV